ncbi:Ig-like domain-containing protein [Shewanella algae]|uniref:Ig-like domain-containing protein n=2 Tax=Shewanella algae TaxID=38313 RepID=UPI0031F4F9B1
MNIVKNLFCILFVVMLFGCGGSDSETDTNLPPDIPNVKAEDLNATLDIFRVGSKVKIDLERVASSSDYSNYQLKNVDVLNGPANCRNVSLSGKYFTVDNTAERESSYCSYKYTLEDEQGNTANGISRVAFNSKEGTILSSELTPISIAMTENSIQRIDVAIPGYTLMDEFLLLGSGSATINPIDSSINYNSTSYGLSKIFYQVTDGVDIKVGTIDIAVSESSNGSPVISDFEYTEVVNPNQEVIIDIASYISDPDNDTLQLYKVYSYNGVAESALPLDTSNTKIKFISPVPGDQFISVTITDHHGGYATASIKISVSNYYGEISLVDSSGDELIFSAPLSYKQLGNIGVNSSPVTEENVPGANGTFVAGKVSFNDAEAFCRVIGGRLPRLEELNSLFESNKAKNYWPIEKERFWSSTEDILSGNHFSVSLSNNSIDTSLAESYFSCINQKGSYVVEFELKNSLMLRTYEPIIVNFHGEDNIKQVFDGDIEIVAATPELSKFELSVFKDSNFGVGNILSTGTKSGKVSLKFRLLKNGHPLNNYILEKKITLIEEKDYGLWGGVASVGGHKVKYTFNDGQKMYCRGGAIIDRAGFSDSDYAGGVGGARTYYFPTKPEQTQKYRFHIVKSQWAFQKKTNILGAMWLLNRSDDTFVKGDVLSGNMINQENMSCGLLDDGSTFVEYYDLELRPGEWIDTVTYHTYLDKEQNREYISGVDLVTHYVNQTP